MAATKLADATDTPLRHLSNPDYKGPDFITSFPLEGRALLAKITQAQSPPDIQGEDAVGSEILVENWIAHRVQLTETKTGEKADHVRIVFFQPDGKTVSFISEGILTAFQQIVTILGPGPYDPALKIAVRENRSKANRRFYSLVLME